MKKVFLLSLLLLTVTLTGCEKKQEGVCKFDGENVIYATYVNGQYVYRYQTPEYYGGTGNEIHREGWNAELIDDELSRPVTTKICTTINGKPLVSMNSLFDTTIAVSVDLSNLDTSNIVDMTSMFRFSALKKVDLSNFDTSNVENMGSMFDSAQVESLDLSNFNTSKVTDMGRMFANTRLDALDLSSFDTSNVTNMSNMFYNFGAETLDLSSFDMSNVTNVESMFSNSIINILYLNESTKNFLMNKNVKISQGTKVIIK